MQSCPPRIQRDTKTFAELEAFARKTGFSRVAAGPFVRSSYQAATLLGTGEGEQ
jgi:lipoate synthase